MFIDSYNCPLPIDKVIPVDIYIPGCPPKPEAIIAGVVKLIEKVKQGAAKK
jgi:NADH:ubiquinone oxidoreductase subunit B-like Fe-S oxidoreductase